ncbi:MAG: hypothetical protein L6R41_007962 [Letrouitia leprolyta]|nr:MAG: hypothetical protein L6R41_007962 [Letrouitia leprolyta]
MAAIALLARFSLPLAKPSFTLPVRASIQTGGTRQLHLQSYIVTPKELSNALTKNVPTKNASGRVVPLCAAWLMPNDPQGRTGRQLFQEKRIPSAKFFDVDAVKDHGSPYPHMLPSPENFARAMQKLGIKKDDEIVVYDTQELGLFSAPRVAWTLRVFGHPDVHILNNFRLWVQQGYPTEDGKMEASEEESSNYPVPSMDASKVVHFSEMKDIVQDQVKGNSKGIQIVDARSVPRWTGAEPEPRPGLPNGHMPGSINVPFSELLDPDTRTLLPGQKLRQLFESKGLDPEKPIVNSCGTGVTAAVVDAAMSEAGFGEPENRKLYDGSWTEWAQRVTEADGMILKKL